MGLILIQSLFNRRFIQRCITIQFEDYRSSGLELLIVHVPF